MKVKIEYVDVNQYGGFSQYALIVTGDSVEAVELEFYDITNGWDAVFSEVTA